MTHILLAAALFSVLCTKTSSLINCVSSHCIKMIGMDQTTTFALTSQKSSVFQGSDVAGLKYQLLQLGAALDRGQSYNPTSGEYYKERMDGCKAKIESLVALAPASAKSLKDIEGEWELVVTTVPNGIFRSSPFFLAIQEAFHIGGDPEKAALFFKLHELQTCSWGISKIGRVAQFIDAENGILYSEFDTSIFALTTIPILGWFKLLPTFGGCVVTVSEAKLNLTTGSIDMEVDYTTAYKVPGLDGIGNWTWDIKVPVGSVWRLLPWNRGRKATCSVQLVYNDGDMRIVRDIDGEYFVYSRPVLPRSLYRCSKTTTSLDPLH